MMVVPQILVVARLIGWLIVHSLWQGALLGLVYAGGRAFVPRGEPRYRFGLAMLAALLAMQAVTVMLLWQGGGSPALGAEPASQVEMSAVVNVSNVDAASWIDAIPASLPWVALVWSAGVVLLASRAGIQWLDVRHLLRSAQAAPVWQDRLDRLAPRFGLAGRVGVLYSDAVRSPVLVGLIRPVILLPVALTCGMPVAQVELILAHELAHIRRLDPLTNVFQVAIETLYFHHPAVRWISREVRNEREICCDRMALTTHSGSRRDYIEALATLGELARRQPWLLAANGGLLLERVQLIASPHHVHAGRGLPARMLAACLGFAVAAVALSHVWGPPLPTITWSPDLSQQSQPGLEAQARRGSLLLLDLIPRRVAVTYPDPATPLDRPLPAIPAISTAIAHRPPQISQVPVAFLAPVVGRPGVSVNIDPPVPSANTAPAPVRARPPVYPRQALEAGIEGRVVIEFSIGPQGDVRDTRVIRSEPEGVFDQAALVALRDWRYAAHPGTSATRYRQAIGFTLHDPAARTGHPQDARGRWPCTVVTGTHICRFPEGQRAVSGTGQPLPQGQLTES